MLRQCDFVASSLHCRIILLPGKCSKLIHYYGLMKLFTDSMNPNYQAVFPLSLQGSKFNTYNLKFKSI